MKLQLFNGGLNTRTAEHLLRVNEGVLYSNIDNEAGNLKPIKSESSDLLSINEWAHYFVSQDIWVSSANDREYIEYQNSLYYTEENAIPKIFDGINTYNLGILRPANPPTIPSTDTGVLTGTYTYVYTYYNSETGVESAQSSISAEVTVIDKKISLANLFASTDIQVNKKRIYRVGGNLTSFSLIATIDNDILIYTDNLADIDVSGDLLTSSDNEQAPSGLKYLIEYEGMFFGILGDRIRFTPIGIPYAWPSEFFIPLYTTGTGIGKVSNGLLAFTKDKTEIIIGKTPTTLSKHPLSGDQGCKDHKSIKEVSTGLIWVSNDGLCSSTGGPVTVVSKDKLGKIDLNIKNVVLHDQVYYVQENNGSILAADFRYLKIFKRLDLGNTNLVVGQDKLYGYFNNNYQELFKGEDFLSLIFKSPRFLDGSYIDRKSYKSIYIKSRGSLQIEFFIDKKSVLIRDLSSTENHEITIPQKEKNGYSLQYIITGTGTIEELTWKPGGPTNGS